MVPIFSHEAVIAKYSVPRALYSEEITRHNEN